MVPVMLPTLAEIVYSAEWTQRALTWWYLNVWLLLSLGPGEKKGKHEKLWLMNVWKAGFSFQIDSLRQSVEMALEDGTQTLTHTHMHIST